MPTTDEITIKSQSGAIAGWTDFRLTVGLERGTRDFAVGMTERFPGQAGLTIVQPGDSCQVYLGADLVHTGYVNRFLPAISKSNHTILIQGRGKCQDLVDCSAEYPGNQISGISALAASQQLAKPYGITVSGEAGQMIPQLNVIVGETPWSIVDRIVKYSGLIAYELPDGSLTLARVGATSAASGFTEGKNVQEASIDFNDYERYSDYESHLLAFDPTGEIPDNGTTVKKVSDPNVKRHRLYKFITEADGGQQAVDLGTARATWEMNRRAGHSAIVTVVTDSWRDGAGALWQPNTLVPLSLPTLKLTNVNYLVSNIIFSRVPDRGTLATLQLMNPLAFAPEPIILLPGIQDVTNAVDQSQGRP